MPGQAVNLRMAAAKTRPLSPAQAHPLPQNDVWAWYAIQTRYRLEKKVASQLRDKGVETFLPLRQERHRWSDREQAVSLPLLPGYAFVRLCLSPSSRMCVLRTSGLIGFLTSQGKPVPVPAKQVEDLQLLLSTKVPCSLHPFLRVGQRVRIRGGCLNGVEGILTKKDPKKLVISIESMERAVAVEIAGYELDPV